MCDFIDCTKLDNPNMHLIKQILVNALCEYFTLIGETFCGSQSPELNMKLSQKQSKNVDQIHNNTLEALKSSLETEMWQVGLPKPRSIAAVPDEACR